MDTRACLVVMLLVTSAALQGERLPTRVLTTADGLPRDQVACVKTDTQGFVWFCSPEGLVRYDGYSARTFGPRDGLDPPGVRTFLRTRAGAYLVGGDRGLFAFDTAPPAPASTFALIPRDDGQRTGAVNGLTESRDGTVWCAAGRGLHRVTRTHDGWRLVEIDIGLPRQVEADRIVHAVGEDEHGTLWVAAGSGVYIRRADGYTRRLSTRDGLPIDEVVGLAIGPGVVWAATREGLVLIDPGAVRQERSSVLRRIYTERDGLPAHNVRALHVDAGGRTLWVATVSGVVETSLTTTGELLVGRAVPGFIAWDVTTDRRGDVWMATDTGARRLSQRGFTSFGEDDGLPSARLDAVFESRTGEVCATSAVRHFELSCFDGRRFRRAALPAANVLRDPGWGWSQGAFQDRLGGWWIPTGEGLLRFAAGTVGALAAAKPQAVYGQRQGLRSNNIFRVFEDARGGVWVATFAEDGNGIARIDPRSGAVRTFTARDGLPERLPIVYAIAEDHAGHVWFGLEERRLLKYDGRFAEIPVPDQAGRLEQPTYDHLEALLVDSRGRLWIGSTANGLARIDDPAASPVALTWHSDAASLSSHTVWSLVEDASGDILIGTGRGVDRLDSSTGRVTHYSSDDGVPRGEIRGALRDRQGRVWMATTTGLARLDGDRRAPVETATPLITATRVAGVPGAVPADGSRRIAEFTVQRGGRLEIDYVSPGVRESDGLRYEYRLEGEGADGGWTTTDARTMTFVNVAPGTYRFLVRSVVASGAASPTAEVRFIVPAPFWRRPWVTALVVVVAGMVAFGFHRNRLSRLLELDRVRSRIAADLHDGVGAHLSRVAVLSEVVKQQVGTQLPDAMPALGAIADNARAVIDDMDDAIWSIDPRLDTLQHVIVRVRGLASELFDGSAVGYTVEAIAGADRLQLGPEQRRHVYLMLKESLTNTLRHARASRVTVRMTPRHGRLRIEVSDDGVGMAPASQPGTTKDGRGLPGLRSRATALGGTLVIESGPGARGTHIVVDVPLSPHGRAVGSRLPRS